MPNPAVTDSASAVERETSNHMEEAVETGFLPDDPHYRLTGEFKPEKEGGSAPPQEDGPEKEPADIQEASAASESETAAASEAAQTQEKDKKGKTQQTSESRWAKLSRENREIREENARLKAVADERSAQRDSKQASQPAAEAKPANAKPQPADNDEKGNPKYKTWDDYLDARDAWNRGEAIREVQELNAKTAQERQQKEQFDAIGKNLAEKFKPSREKYADFDEVALNPDLLMPINSAADLFIQASPHAGEVAYYLGQHPEILEGFYGKNEAGNLFNRIPVTQQLAKLMEIQAEVAGASSPAKPASAKPVTAAPAPPHQVSGNGTVAKDALEQAVEDQDQETYMRAANARELARLKRK